MKAQTLVNQALKQGFKEFLEKETGTGRIVHLKTEAFLKLINDKILRLGEEDYFTHSDMDLENNDYCFVYSDGFSEDLWSYQPPDTLEDLLHHSYFCLYNQKPKPLLTLASVDNVYLILLELMKNMGGQPIPPLKEQKFLQFDKVNVEKITDLKEFSGRLGGCGESHASTDDACGEPMCQSTFAWIKDYICLIYMVGSCDGFLEIKLLPFRTTDKHELIPIEKAEPGEEDTEPKKTEKASTPSKKK
ncbi:hypothetical protein [Nitrospina watsonii]|uniref:PPM-type phosphatase domain-containing protein n=1 Tax=Nitrospina watsonii TaxID=1323948 RepID=A0ABM9HHW2_9BACT|nr:hypothetical protein [Nitrospina watsonii]CAI2719650.1 conserved protein of unknown function [Nitrospina watsonii]